MPRHGSMQALMRVKASEVSPCGTSRVSSEEEIPPGRLQSVVVNRRSTQQAHLHLRWWATNCWWATISVMVMVGLLCPSVLTHHLPTATACPWVVGVSTAVVAA